MFGQDSSNPKLQSLLEDLKRKKRLNVQGVWLPDEDTIEKISEIGDPAAIPALEQALAQTRKFQVMAEGLSNVADPTAPGSASPMLVALLAQQTARKIEDAMSKCRGGSKKGGNDV